MKGSRDRRSQYVVSKFHDDLPSSSCRVQSDSPSSKRRRRLVFSRMLFVCHTSVCLFQAILKQVSIVSFQEMIVVTCHNELFGLTVFVRLVFDENSNLNPADSNGVKVECEFPDRRRVEYPTEI